LQIAHDNINDVIELVESFRDTINSTRDLYLASISMQMNDTMRILTIFTAVLLPLTLRLFSWYLWHVRSRLDQNWHYTNRISSCHFHDDYNGYSSVLVLQMKTMDYV
jgi:hypothetical protein